MQERPLDATGRARSWLPWAFLLYLAFVVYGSLLPFELRPPPTAGAWEAFLRLPYLQLGVASRADWVANLLLYIPLGFLAVGSAQGRSAPNLIHGLAALIVVGAVTVGVEYAQIFFAPRTVSMNDLVAEWLGAVVGIALWYVTRERFARLLTDVVGSGTTALRAAILLYLAGYLVLAVFPFDFLVSLDELRWRLSTDSWGLVFAPAAGGGTVRRTLQLFVDVAAMVPLGILIASGGSSTPRDAMRRSAIAGAAIGLMIEGLQFLTASGISQGASVVVRSGGAVLGVWLAGRAPVWTSRPIPGWTRTVLLLALPIYALVLASLNGWFAAPWLSLDEAVARLKPEAFLPFYYHYFTTELDAMQSLVANALMYAPVGIGCWLYGAAGRSAPRMATPVILSAVLAAVVELGKFFAPAKHADPTNVLIAGAAAAAAFAVARWVRRAISAPDQAARRAAVSAPVAMAPGFGEEAATAAWHGDVPSAATAAVGRSFAMAWPRSPVEHARVVVGALCLLFAVGILVRYPLWQLWLGMALVAYGVALWRNPSLWLVVIPALLPSLDLATLSGWYFVDELDLFLLVTVGVALLRPAAGQASVPLPRLGAVLLALFAASYAIATLRGMLPLGTLDLNALSSPYGSYETLRVAKGVIWAFVLLPLLRRAFTAPARAGRYLVTGMTLGLLLAGAAVFRERLLFTGLLDFSQDFRATGMFSGMHTGGAEIEAYLVMALPFALLALTQRGRWYGTVLGLAAFTLGTYALLVTFARGGYAAGAIGLGVTALGLVVARRPRRTGARSWGRVAGMGMASAVIAVLAIVAVSAPYMAKRFAGTTGDLDTRWNHWVDALAMMDDAWATSLFGMGVGRFPETYFWKTEKGDRPGTFAFAEQGGNRYLRLGAGDPLYLRQRVALRPGTQYRLSLDARSSQPGTAFRVFLCEQTLLYSGRCEARSFTATRLDGAWEAAEVAIDSGEIGSANGLTQRPVFLGLNYPAGDALVEIDNVKLLSPDGVNLLSNGDFERGFDFWFFAVDWDPAWHIHNLWVAVFFEQGWLGIVAFILLAAYGLAAAARSTARGSRTSAAILGAVVALLVVGLVGSVYDFPRISLLFFVLLFVGVLRSNAYSRRRDIVGGGPAIATGAG